MSTEKPKIKGWSYSRLEVFEKCKRYAFLKFIQRIPDPRPNPTADRGTKIHLKAEHYVMGKIDHLPQELKKFEEEFEFLRTLYQRGKVSLEGEWGFDKDWKPVDWRSAWLRVKCDAVVWLDDKTIVVIDYKTGKKFGNEIKHGEQTQMYAAAACALYPQVETIHTELWYLDQDELTPAKHSRSRSMIALSRFNERGLKITEATVFPPNPSKVSCKWCPYKPSGTGDCKVGVE